ncbi:MAG: phosphate ABC transporter substrate-binding protein PstS [Gemmatimonadetes bacterium]|nr:phosphate ABC transporter substrate-binding protein PstS [Gemmatimonadota bacterium]
MPAHAPRLRACLAAAAFAAVVACGGDADARNGSAAGVDLTGAGATFPYPLYSRWFADYAARTGVRINYQSIGSGGGIRQLLERTVDFGASEAPATDEELARAKGGAVLQLPLVAGAVAIVYNLPGITEPLKLTGDLVADLFLGKVARWNDARVQALNPGVALPDQPVLVVFRADPSGSGYVLGDYLSHVSPAWKAGPGTHKELAWPVGLGAKGNEGLAGQLKLTPYAIGFVEFAYARQNGLSVAALRNKAGQFVLPSRAGIAAALAPVAARGGASDDFRISIVDGDAPAAYPICTLSWILLYREPPDPARGRKLADFMRWALHSGRAAAEELDYQPLPDALVARVDRALDALPGAAAAVGGR